jgi:hypothetical protein
MSQNNAVSVPIWNWVFVPFLITLAVTVIRLLGELNQWSRFWFNPEPGGGGAPIGIVWLVPIFGLYFGWKLGKSRQAPASVLKPVLSAIAGFVVIALTGLIGSRLKLSPLALELLFGVASIVGGYIAYRSWPSMGRIQLAYGLAARVPVAILMLFAISGNWGTHYDLPPPGFPGMSLFPKWIVIGLIPQMTVWIAFTIIVGILFGAIIARMAAPKATSA